MTSPADNTPARDRAPQRVLSRPPEDPAAEAWNAMQQLVLNEDRRRGAAAELGMPFSRIRALRRIAAAEGITQRELADLMSTDAAYTTVTVDDLEKRGLVVREPHPEDRRVKVVRVTPAGATAAAEAERVMRRPPASLVALSATELLQLRELVRRL